MTQPDEWIASVLWALREAAVLNADLLSSLPQATNLSMPPDIFERLWASWYQDALDACPPEIREWLAAQPISEAMQRARAIDANARRAQQ